MSVNIPHIEHLKPYMQLNIPMENIWEIPCRLSSWPHHVSHDWKNETPSIFRANDPLLGGSTTVGGPTFWKDMMIPAFDQNIQQPTTSSGEREANYQLKTQKTQPLQNNMLYL